MINSSDISELRKEPKLLCIKDDTLSIILFTLGRGSLKITCFVQPCRIDARITDERCLCAESAASISVIPASHILSGK